MYGDFEYYKWSEKINRRYSIRHGYEHVISREIPRNDRHVTWHKIPVILSELHDCDYLLWTDADTFFYSQELKIERELLPLIGEFPILCPPDIVSEKKRWNPDVPCSGVMLLKNCETSREIFEYWNTVSEIDEESRWRWPPEQIALWKIVLPLYGNNIKVLEDYYVMNGIYSQYIRHLPRLTDEERTNTMKTFFTERLEGIEL